MKLGTAQVAIEIEGRTKYLRPTIEAILELSRRWRGFQGLKVALRQETIDAVVDVLCYGLSVPENERRGIEEWVCAAGLFLPEGGPNLALLRPIDDYIVILTQGGRPPPAPAPEAKGDPPSGEAGGG